MALTPLDPKSALIVTNSVERIFPRLGETGCTAEILALLERPAAH